MANSRKAWVTVEYDGKNITEAVSDCLISASFVDKSSDEADELDITVHNRDGRWHSDWYPKARVMGGQAGEAGASGAVLRVKIHTENWHTDGDYSELDCGAFEIDNCELSGPPCIATIKAVSTPVSSALRREEKCRGWEEVTLQKIARDIADCAGLSLIYEVKDNIILDRAEQLQQSDLSFLQILCHNYGVSLKVTDKQVVLFDEEDYERRLVVDTFKSEEVRTGDNPSGRILAYKFSQNTSDCVSSSTVAYKDPKSGKLVKFEFKPPDAPATGQAIKSNQRPGNISGDPFRTALGTENTNSPMTGAPSADYSEIYDTKQDFSDIRADVVPAAERLAKAQAREKNKLEWTCEIETIGDTGLVAGVTFCVSGFGVYDGKYIITEAAHNVGNGYATKSKGHKVLNGY